MGTGFIGGELGMRISRQGLPPLASSYDIDLSLFLTRNLSPVKKELNPLTLNQI
jgi:hypothetical protein